MERVLRIEQLVQGGDGLARDDGLVVFVPLTAPGDVVRVEVDQPRGGASRARILELVERGPSRIEPPCPLVGTCGGCQWQQVSLPAQQAAKEQAVRDALSRIGGFSDLGVVKPLVPSPKEWRYRRRLRAHLTGNGWGFSQRASNALVDVEACLLVEEAAEQLTHQICAALHSLRGFGSIRSFAVDVTDGVPAKGALHLELEKAPAQQVRTRGQRLLGAVPSLTGIVFTGPDGSDAMLVGDPTLVDASHRRLRVRPDLFAQANRLGARLLADATASTVREGSAVLELFAGAGTLTLAMVERTAQLVANEGDGPALDLLRTSLRENGRKAQLIAGPAARVAGALAEEGRRFDHVVLDPPRTGAKEVVPAIVRLKPERITYVSCDPPTFARDAALLARAGWTLQAVTPYDLFPHTHHVELLAEFG